jgi:hypothetical protein
MSVNSGMEQYSGKGRAVRRRDAHATSHWRHHTGDITLGKALRAGPKVADCPVNAVRLPPATCGHRLSCKATMTALILLRPPRSIA